jgi:ferredoxin/flavodoxin---NADP+ reductase
MAIDRHRFPANLLRIPLSQPDFLSNAWLPEHHFRRPMSKILFKQSLAPSIVRMRIESPRIAKKRAAGQFIMVRPTANDERIPLTIADADPDAGWVELIFQVVGQGTSALSALQVGDDVADFVGPLGRPTHIERFGRVLCVGGGVGAAPLHPIARALGDAGNEVTTVIGARTRDLLMLQDEMRAFSHAVHIATDDGSAGHHGFVTDVVVQLLEQIRFDFAVVIGPAPMMRATSALLVARGIPTVVSLNPIMVDGTGMCGGCRVTVHGKTQFACVDGPEFDAAGIDWSELTKRLGSYREFEQRRREEHQCRLKVVP